MAHEFLVRGGAIWRHTCATVHWHGAEVFGQGWNFIESHLLRWHGTKGFDQGWNFIESHLLLWHWPKGFSQGWNFMESHTSVTWGGVFRGLIRRTVNSLRQRGVRYCTSAILLPVADLKSFWKSFWYIYVQTVRHLKVSSDWPHCW
jgi:hypothetical protein